MGVFSDGHDLSLIHIFNTDVIDEAVSQYAGGSLIKQYMIEKDLAAAPVEVELETEVDSAKVKNFVDTQCQGITAEPQNASITRENGQFVITDSVPGRVVDVAGTEAAPVSYTHLYGKALRAIGGSENAAYSTGIRVGKIKFCAYCLAGLLCAVAGIFLSAQMNSADATIGKNYAMNAITATVVGGTAMTGAVGDPLGTIAGVFIISIINNMLNLFGVSSFYQFICLSLIHISKSRARAFKWLILS